MTQKYRPNVGIMLINRDKKVFVAQRIDTPGPAWQMPQGGIDAGEDELQAVFRELEEEIGTDKVEIIAQSPDWLYYDLPKALQEKLWNGDYVGQKQKWFLMRFLGNDADINLNTAHPEFLRWQWVEPERLPTLAIDFKQVLYAKILKIFEPFLQ